MSDNGRCKFRYSYVIVAACFSIQAIGIGTYISYGVFFNQLITEFGWSRTSISGASSLAFFLMGLFGIYVGRLNDRIGPRMMMGVTGFAFGIGLLLMSRLNSIWQLYLFYGVIIGIGLSSTDIISLSTTARWFVKKRGLMTGIVKVGTGAGQMLIPFTASILIMNFGWRTSYIIIGASVLILLVSIGQLLRRDPGEMSSSRNNENEMAEGKSHIESEGLSLHEALHTWQFWTLCAAYLTIVYCLMVIMVHVVPFAQDMGVSPASAAGVLSTIGGISMAGRFFTGIFIDRIGNRKTIIFCFVLLISGLLWLQIANELWMLYLFALIYGFAHGGFFTSMSPIVAEFFGIKAHGVLFGIVAFSGSLGGSIGPLFAGYIFDAAASYGPAFWISILIASIGLILTMLLKPIVKMKKA